MSTMLTPRDAGPQAWRRWISDGFELWRRSALLSVPLVVASLLVWYLLSNKAGLLAFTLSYGALSGWSRLFHMAVAQAVAEGQSMSAALIWAWKAMRSRRIFLMRNAGWRFLVTVLAIAFGVVILVLTAAPFEDQAPTTPTGVGFDTLASTYALVWIFSVSLGLSDPLSSYLWLRFSWDAPHGAALDADVNAVLLNTFSMIIVYFIALGLYLAMAWLEVPVIIILVEPLLACIALCGHRDIFESKRLTAVHRKAREAPAFMAGRDRAARAACHVVAFRTITK